MPYSRHSFPKEFSEIPIALAASALDQYMRAQRSTESLEIPFIGTPFIVPPISRRRAARHAPEPGKGAPRPYRPLPTTAARN